MTKQENIFRNHIQNARIMHLMFLANDALDCIPIVKNSMKQEDRRSFSWETDQYALDQYQETVNSAKAETSEENSGITQTDVDNVLYHTPISDFGIVKSDQTAMYTTFPEYGGKPITTFTKGQAILINRSKFKNGSFFVVDDTRLKLKGEHIVMEGNPLTRLKLKGNYFTVDGNSLTRLKLKDEYVVAMIKTADNTFKKGFVVAKGLDIFPIEEVESAFTK